MLSSPWDGQDGEVRRLVAGEHVCTGIDVTLPSNGDDPCFALEFQAASGGELLKVRLPAREMVALGKLLIELSEARSWCRNV
jgi:hypothetical protein